MATSNKRKRTSHAVEEIYSSSSTLAAEDDNSSGLEDDDDWEEEQDYEKLGRSLYKKKEQKESTRLPIRTTDGRIVQVPEPILERAKEQNENEEDEDEGMGGMDDSDADDDDEDEKAEEMETEPVGPPKSEAELIMESKEELAKLASAIIEDPEENAVMLNRFSDMYESTESNKIRSYVLGTLLAVYKDIIPGYRIRSLTEEEKQIKVSKEVKKLRSFEHSLIINYQKFIAKLAELGKSRQQKDAQLTTTAITCACSLLDAVPHFNCRDELLQIVVYRLGMDRIDASSTKCLHAIETLFENDESGVSSLDAVRLITKTLKAKNYHANEYVLNTFLSLRLLSELDLKSLQEEAENRRKMKKKDRKPWTKRQKKEEKEKKVLAAQMKEADAVVHHEEREKMQNETLKLVFATYFHILQDPRSPLIGATLEGLAKFAHLINIDFFADILKALKEIIIDAEEEVESLDGDAARQSVAMSNLCRRSLLCIVTSFALLFGQGSDAHKTMNLDLTFFIKHLYVTIINLSVSPTLEHNSKSLHLSNPDDDSGLPKPTSKKVNVDTEMEMLIRSLDFVFFRSARSMGGVSAMRLAAFTKRLYASTLQMPEKSTLAALKLLEKMMKVHSKKLTHLVRSDELVGDGVYNAYADEPELSNPMAASVMWENALLAKHYSPKVAGAAKATMKLLNKT